LYVKREVEKLKEYVDKVIDERGTTVEDGLDHLLTDITTVKSKDVKTMFEEGMFGRVFWDAQKRQEIISNAVPPSDVSLVSVPSPPGRIWCT